MSTIIPTYNRADVLTRAVNSVLNQTLADLELIIVDDGSTDGTDEIVKAYGDSRIIHLRHDRNKGGSAARNTGIRKATGRYVAFLDSDDEWLPEKLEKQVSKLIKTGNTVGGIYCGSIFVRDRFLGIKKTIPAVREGNLKTDVLLSKHRMKAGSTLVVKSEALAAIGFFDETFPRFQDTEFCLRFFDHFDIVSVREPLARIHFKRRVKGDDLISYQTKFFETFRKDIMALEPKLRLEMEAVYWMSLSKSYAAERNLKTCCRYLRKSMERNPPTIRQSLSLIYHFVTGI